MNDRLPDWTALGEEFPTLAPKTPEEFGRMIAAELLRWNQVIREARIRQE